MDHLKTVQRYEKKMIYARKKTKKKKKCPFAFLRFRQSLNFGILHKKIHKKKDQAALDPKRPVRGD